jgi:hypothetical protein
MCVIVPVFLRSKAACPHRIVSLLGSFPPRHNCTYTLTQNVLVKKLRQCCVIFDFKKDLPGDTKAKELKRVLLFLTFFRIRIPL